ncbi:MAG: septum formation family protein [Propionibacteriaceae bacterium]|nr:septum formation family protein [Propionibacteriaceae bacterium]
MMNDPHNLNQWNHFEQPQKPNNTVLWVGVIAAGVILAVGIVVFFMFFQRLGPTQQEPSPTVLEPTAPTTSPALPPPTYPTDPTHTPPAIPAGSYERERTSLSAAESDFYGYLVKGACMHTPPDDIEGIHVPTVDCSKPHTDQVMGFVDLSEGMPDRDDVWEYELALSRRCNSLKATLDVPKELDRGVSAGYPDQAHWDAGVRVAMCWVPTFDTIWVGSVIDGTAEVI